jgi:hypothetical protein
MALSKEKACDDTLESLDMVWNAVSSASTSWAERPAMQPGVATRNIQIVVKNEARDIKSFAAAVKEEVIKDLLNDTAIRLEAFTRAAGGGGIVNAIELVRTWKKAVRGMIADIVKAVPAVKQTDRYVRLMDRFAA